MTDSPISETLDVTKMIMDVATKTLDVTKIILDVVNKTLDMTKGI